MPAINTATPLPSSNSVLDASTNMAPPDINTPSVAPEPISNTTPNLKNPPSTFKGNFVAGMKGPRDTTDSNGNIVPVNQGSPTKQGLLGSVLAGAVMGALHGAAATRKGERGGVAFASGVRMDQQIRDEQNERAKQLAQQNFANKQSVQRAADAHQQSQDAHTNAILESANLSAQNIKITRELDAMKQNAPLDFAAKQMAILTQAQAMKKTMEDNGHVSLGTFDEPGSGTANDPMKNLLLARKLTVSHEAFAVPHVDPQTGMVHGVDIYQTDALHQPTTTDVVLKIPTGKLDSTGKPEFKDQTLPQGSVNLGLALKMQSDSAAALVSAEKDQSALKEQAARTNQLKAQTQNEYKDAELKHQQALDLVAGNTPDVFGKTSSLDRKQYNERWNAFNKSTLTPLITTTNKSYELASEAYDDYKAAQAAGKQLPTGAQSMMMLSQHLSTTFGNVRGARVTKDMIAEHLGSRGLSDDAVAAVQKLTNGDRLSPKQWDAFYNLISSSRQDAYKAAIDLAEANQLHTNPILPANHGPKGSLPDQNTVNLYVYAAHGDNDAALKALKQNGFGDGE